MLEKTGIPSDEQINSRFPSQERLEKGPVAVIECYQSIPCNPCFTACKRNAIQPFADINDLPEINTDNCNGCGLCVSRCPGLSIMVVDWTYSDTHALLKIPYEFLPLPEEGSTVMGLDRAGQSVAPVTVVKVLNTPAMDKTPIVSIAVDKKHLKTIRNIGGAM